MGVVTGTLFKGLNFGGIDSRDYGVYITGEAVYNAPVRDVEMITVPGRNGAYALDRGRFENITVTYPAGMMEGTAADFADNISDFRNALAALTGYQRLMDDYNPDEYRQAVYTGGLEVEAATGHNAGEFEIVFTCKPQRFLTAGEQAVTVTSGDELDNPTLFSSRPLLMVWGDGNIIIGEDTITVEDVPVGGLALANYSESWDSVGIDQAEGSVTKTRSVTIDESLMNAGDTITISSFGFTYRQAPTGLSGVTSLDSVSVSYSDTFTDKTISRFVTSNAFQLGYLAGPFTFTAGTAGAQSVSGSISCRYTQNGTSVAKSAGFSASVAYDGAGTITVTKTFLHPASWESSLSEQLGDITVYSTKTPEGSAVFIDLDIGEAYFHVDGSPVSADNLVTFGHYELPELDPGTNVITFDNTVTQLQVVPRWWKV